jgi:hypothetical protein
MAYIMVDVETDGPIPGDHSIISFGAVPVNNAKGNAEALLTLKEEYGLKIRFRNSYFS